MTKTEPDCGRFKWTRFYEALADKLLAFKDHRDELISGIHTIESRVRGLSYLRDRFADGSSGPLQDICPFTTMGIFNRGITDARRKDIASELASLLDVVEPVPESFEGIPILNNMMSLFFGFEKERQPDDIDNLWEVFEQAIAFADNSDADARSAFASAYDNATQGYGVGWTLTMGLYWIRPWKFPTLEKQSRNYISEKLSIEIGRSGAKRRSSASDYLAVLDTLETQFQDDAYPVHSFPELSLAAYEGEGGDAGSDVTDAVTPNDNEETNSEAKVTGASIKPYSIDDIVTDGCFVARKRLEEILKRLEAKKNLILQGPPGTGKTWLAKRLAFALMKQRDESKVRAVQFHPNLSYEDFVRGWRPVGDGKLTLVDGPLVEMRNAAEGDPTSDYVLVIEEINRGNPAQILGEMLTLLEVDKRTQSEALELSYKRCDGERIFLPLNLYVIGTMNVADRSLALVDLALRRRFAFIDLEPMLGKCWQNWVQANCGIDSDFLVEIGKRLNALNSEISTDTALGPQYRVGHSYVTPTVGDQIVDAQEWFRQVVETEIGPLLDEYWFDALAKSRKAKEDLLAGL